MPLLNNPNKSIGELIISGIQNTPRKNIDDLDMYKEIISGLMDIKDWFYRLYLFAFIRDNNDDNKHGSYLEQIMIEI